MLHSSDVGGLVAEIVSQEPLVKHRSEQLEKLISSEQDSLALITHNHIFLRLELKEKLSQPFEKNFYSFKVLRAHILPLTNVAFNKSGSR